VGVVAVDVPAGGADLLLDGNLAILPTDTVYGLAAAADRVDACGRAYRLKRRPPDQATAIMLGSVDALIELALPGLPRRTAAICRQLLPGPVTLVVPNPAGRFVHLCGDAPHRIGVRVPDLEAAVAELADAAGGLMITSANERGGPDPARLEQVPRSLREAAAFEVEGGALPGRASSVIDVTGHQPRVLRRGAGADRAMAVLR
jgi:L-threonylcarbamoyladenylate synthase